VGGKKKGKVEKKVFGSDKKKSSELGKQRWEGAKCWGAKIETTPTKEEGGVDVKGQKISCAPTKAHYTIRRRIKKA